MAARAPPNDAAPQPPGSDLLAALRTKSSLIDSINDNKALEWTVSEIITRFLSPLSMDPANWGVVESCREAMKPTCEALIKWLRCTEQTRVTIPNLSFSLCPTRAVMEKGKGPLDTDQRRELPIPLLSATSPTINFHGQGVYDILGWIFSAFGPVSIPKEEMGISGYYEGTKFNTVKETFFYPLLLLYAKWVYRISAIQGPKDQDCPAMVELAVRAVSRDTLYFAVGASMAGFPKGDNDPVCRERKAMMEKAKLLTFIAELPDRPYPIESAGILDSKFLELSLTQLLSLVKQNSPVIIYNNRKYPVWKQELTKTQIEKRTLEVKAEVNAKSKLLNSEKEWIEYQKQMLPLRAEEEALAKRLVEIAQWENSGIEFSGWRELYFFAQRWLNPETLGLQSKFSGTPWGNCAETYPLLILSNAEYRWTSDVKPPASPWGGIAINPTILDSIRIYDLQKLQELEVSGKSALLGPCLNCRVLIESVAIGGDKLSFFTGTETPFSVEWKHLKGKVTP